MMVIAQHGWHLGTKQDLYLSVVYMEAAAKIHNYDRYDFIESSTWPYTSFEVRRGSATALSATGFRTPVSWADRISTRN